MVSQLMGIGTLFVLLAVANAQPCGSAGNVSLRFPGFPSQYSMDVEVNVEGFNYSVFLNEYYDRVGSNLKVDYFGGVTSTVIANLTSQKAFLVNTDGSCAYVALTSPVSLSDVVQRSFEPYYSGDAVQIASIWDIFNLASPSALYVDRVSVRGIPSDHWQACVVSPDNSTYRLDFYYSASGWVAPFGNTQVPLELVVSRSTGLQSVVTHLFSFVDVNTGPRAVQASTFDVPLGLVCQNRPAGKPLPPIANYFSVLIEIVSSNSSSLRVFMVNYDYTSLLFLSEGYNSQFNRSFFLLEDFNTLTLYMLDKSTRQCTVSGIGPNTVGLAGYGVDAEAGATVRMRSPKEFFLGFDDAADFSFVYEGVTSIRGMTVDAWITFRPFERITRNVNLTNVTYEIFFTVPQWSIYSLSSPNVNPAIMGLKWVGTLNTHSGSAPYSQYVDFIGFADVKPATDMFDVSARCQSASDYVVFSMSVPGSLKTADIGVLTSSIRQNLISFVQPMNVIPLQIGNIQILGERNGQILLSLRVSNLTSFNPNISLASAASIVTALNAAAASSGGQLPFSVAVSPGNLVTPTIQLYPMTITTTVTTTITSTPVPTTAAMCPTLSSALSSQGVVVLAISMLLLGILMVIVIFLVVVCVRRCSRSGPFALGAVAYKKHTNELIS